MGNLLGIFRHLFFFYFFGLFGNIWGTYWDCMVHEPIDIYWEYVGKWWEMSAPTPAIQGNYELFSNPLKPGNENELGYVGRWWESSWSTWGWSIRIDVWVGAGWNHQPCKNLIKLVKFNSPPVFVFFFLPWDLLFFSHALAVFRQRFCCLTTQLRWESLGWEILPSNW